MASWIARPPISEVFGWFSAASVCASRVKRATRPAGSQRDAASGRVPRQTRLLPAAFTEDKERLSRFEREAQVLAQLHHPNIASIFGLEESNEVRALVMELVEGPTLDERLEKGDLSVEESLSIARQIAEGLEEAHEKGIIHRDFKPQNVKAPVDGKVKVPDFGLAKAMDPAAGAASAADLARSPTLRSSPTLTAAHGTPQAEALSERERRWSGTENGRYANRETALVFPVDYKARDPRLDRPIALEALPSAGSGSSRPSSRTFVSASSARLTRPPRSPTTTSVRSSTPVGTRAVRASSSTPLLLRPGSPSAREGSRRTRASWTSAVFKGGDT